MDYGKAFTFFTEDENWISKLLMAAVFFLAGSVIPVIPLLPVFGFMFELMQNVANNNPRPLPTWDNLEDKFRKGLNIFAIGIVYYLPLILLGCCFAAITIGLSSASGNSRGSTNDTFGALAPLLYLCCTCAVVIYGVLASILSSAATIVYASTGRLADAFKLADVWALARRNLGDFVMIILLIFVASLVSLILIIITCGLGSFVVSPWLMMAQYYLLGQIYRNSLGAMPSSALPTAPAAPSM